MVKNILLGMAMGCAIVLLGLTIISFMLQLVEPKYYVAILFAGYVAMAVVALLLLDIKLNWSKGGR